MKIFNAHVVETKSVDFIVTARTKQEAAKNVADILNTADLIDTMDAKRSVAFQLSENEDECLLDELY